MAYETEVILRSILLQMYKARNLTEAKLAVENLCEKDLIAAVRETYNEYLAIEEQEAKEQNKK